MMAQPGWAHRFPAPMHPAPPGFSGRIPAAAGGGPSGFAGGRHPEAATALSSDAMSEQPSERLLPTHRLTRGRDFARVRNQGVTYRGRFCLVLVLAVAGERSRVGFIASRRGVGGAVERNRARRRLREIVRRRWTRVPEQGYLLVFIASRRTLDAPHQALATDVETLLAHAGALAPLPV